MSFGDSTGGRQYSSGCGIILSCGLETGLAFGLDSLSCGADYGVHGAILGHPALVIPCCLEALTSAFRHYIDGDWTYQNSRLPGRSPSDVGAMHVLSRTIGRSVEGDFWSSTAADCSS